MGDRKSFQVSEGFEEDMKKDAVNVLHDLKMKISRVESCMQL